MVDVNYDNYKFRVTSYYWEKKKFNFFFFELIEKEGGKHDFNKRGL